MSADATPWMAAAENKDRGGRNACCALKMGQGVRVPTGRGEPWFVTLCKNYLKGFVMGGKIDR